MQAINNHIASDDHDSRYFLRSEQVADADTLDGKHAAEFADVTHQHDERYLREVYRNSYMLSPGQQQRVTSLEDPPDLVAISYNLPNPDGSIQATTHVLGERSDELRAWVTKVDQGGGDKDFEVFVRNTSINRLFVNVAIFGRS